MSWVAAGSVAATAGGTDAAAADAAADTVGVGAAEAAGPSGAAPGNVIIASHPRAKPARLAAAGRPESRTALSNASRPNGNAPLAAIAPNMTELTTVPAARAASSMSNVTSRRLWRCATARSRSGSKRPSPGAIFSTVVSVRQDEVTSVVRSALTIPPCTMRTASSSSDATIRSMPPGTGSSERIGRRPPSAAYGSG